MAVKNKANIKPPSPVLGGLFSEDVFLVEAVILYLFQSVE